MLPVRRLNLWAIGDGTYCRREQEDKRHHADGSESTYTVIELVWMKKVSNLHEIGYVYVRTDMTWETGRNNTGHRSTASGNTTDTERCA